MFWKRKPKSPITQEDEEWVIEAFNWFEETFKTDLVNQEIYLPTKGFLDFEYTGSEDDVLDICEIIADRLSLDRNCSIEVYYFEEFQPLEFTDEGVYSNYEEGTQMTNGLYSKVVDGIYQIGIERSLLKNPSGLIATIAHELAHVKLLGEGNLEENDEHLTDLTASLFGFIIFLANGAVSTMTTWSGNTHSGWRIGGSSGYIHYKVYSFIIAYWLTKRQDRSPEWLNFLNKDIKKEVEKGLRYLDSKI